MKEVNLRIPADAECLDLVRICLMGVASKKGFSFEDIEDMKVAVSEACSNAIIHGTDGTRNGFIAITFESSETSLAITIANEGSGFNHASARANASPIAGEKLDDLRVGGLGLYLMEALMDEVEMNSSDLRTEVRLTKYIG